MTKDALRKIIRQKKQITTAEERSAWSDQCARLLEQDEHFLGADTVLLYHALPDEVDLQGVLGRWFREKRLLLPRVAGDELTLHPYEGPESVARGAFGIWEPQTPVFTDWKAIRLAVIPGMAFDLAGHRLGRGKGYYDKLLEKMRHPLLYIIGVAFPFQVVGAVPCEAHDQCVDHLIVAQ